MTKSEPKPDIKPEAPLSLSVVLRGLFMDLYNGYTKKELELQKFCQMTNVVGFALTTALYFNLAKSMQSSQSLQALHTPTAAAAGPDQQQSWQVAVAFVNMCFAVLAVYQSCLVVPSPREESEVWPAVQRIGRWIFLTRHCLTLQSIHCTLTFVSLCIPLDAWPSLYSLAHVLTTIVGTMGIFVMSQFFVLVYPSRQFIVECAAWSHLGIPFRMVQCFCHVPCGIIAFADALLVKERQLLSVVCPPVWLQYVFFLGYVGAYMGLIFANEKATGEYPYGIFRDIGTLTSQNLGKWLTFIIGQTCILLVFHTVLLLAVEYVPVV